MLKNYWELANPVISKKSIQLKLSFLVPLICTSSLLVGCSTQSQEAGTPALFDTKKEAKAAAKDFNCTGAHRMGDKWMPCRKHKDHDHHNNH